MATVAIAIAIFDPSRDLIAWMGQLMDEVVHAVLFLVLDAMFDTQFLDLFWAEFLMLTLLRRDSLMVLCSQWLGMWYIMMDRCCMVHWDGYCVVSDGLVVDRGCVVGDGLVMHWCCVVGWGCMVDWSVMSDGLLEMQHVKDITRLLDMLAHQRRRCTMLMLSLLLVVLVMRLEWFRVRLNRLILEPALFRLLHVIMACRHAWMVLDRSWLLMMSIFVRRSHLRLDND